MTVEVSAIFCDEIRQENNGKYILIGVYTSGMVVRNFPVNQRISALVTFHEAPPSNLMFTLKTPSVAEFGQLEVEMEVDDGSSGPYMIPLPPLPILVSGPDLLQLEVKMGEETVIAGQMRISLVSDTKAFPEENIFRS